MIRLFKATVDLAFPRNCIHCKGIVDSSDYDFLCSTCEQEIIRCNSPACDICGYPFFGDTLGVKSCPQCAELNPLFDRGKTLFIAKGVGRSLIHELKYRNGLYILSDLSKLVMQSKHYLEYIENTILVPVPLHPTRLRERGFNQSEHIAKMLANCGSENIKVESLLTRRQYTQSQTSLNRSERYQNVKNAFTLAPDAVLASTKPYVLIDDVFTTGSTLNACAHVLRAAGVHQIKVATIGHG